MKKFLCLALAGLSIAGGLCAQASEEEWDKGYKIGIEDKYNESYWSQDQKDGYSEGQLHISAQKLKDNPNRGRCCHDQISEYWRTKKEERRKEWDAEK